MCVASLVLAAGCTTHQAPPVFAPVPPVTAHVGPTTLPAPVAPPPPLAAAAAAPLTVEQAVERAQARNLQIQALRAAVTVAKQRRSAASDIQDPEALAAWGNVDDEFTDNGDNADQGKWRTGARVYIPNPFLLSPRIDARSAELMAARADLQAARWGVECDVRRAFAEWNYLAQDLGLARELVRQSEAILKEVRRRAEQGAATAGEIVAAAQRRLQAQNDLDATDSRYRLVQRELAALLDLPSASLQLATNSVPASSLPQPGVRSEPLERTALHSRADLSALHWRALAAKSAFHEARNERIPWLKDVKTWHREPAQEWWVGLAVTVPLFTWTKNHTTDVLLAQDDLAVLNETSGAKLIRREVRDAADELESRRRQQARNQAELVPLLDEMRETLKLLRNSPTVLPVQVATTEAQILESLRLELATRWQFQLAQLNLERALGQPLAVTRPSAAHTP